MGAGLPRLPQLHHLGDAAAALSLRSSASDGDALVHQRRDGNPPALPFLAEHLVVRDADVAEEDLVEFGFPRNLVERPNIDARSVHIENEVREPVVLRHVGVGASDQHPPAREVRDGGPHLLTVQDPVVAIPDGARCQTRHVRARTGLAEELAPDVLAREDPRQ